MLVQNRYQEFLCRFSLIAKKNPYLISNTLSNIFSMRLIGNKTHGDLAEVGIAEFVNLFMYDYRSVHVGKDLFRAKEREEDIVIYSEIDDKEGIPVSLKAYGDGPLQLTTDKQGELFPLLQGYNEKIIEDQETLAEIFSSNAFRDWGTMNVLPLIYREKQMQCSIMVFDFERAKSQTRRIVFVDRGETYRVDKHIITPGNRKHPVFLFLDVHGRYICEVRYGGKAENALQRGLWTHTKLAYDMFNKITDWISYEHNEVLIKLFSIALNTRESAHQKAYDILLEDINLLKEGK